MKKILITGPVKLKGKVKIQGAKNSAMKHVVVPLISNGIYTLENIPQISSINNLIEIIKLQGIKNTLSGQNELILDSRSCHKSHIIPKELFYHTSGGIYPIPILASKYGECVVETDPGRSDYGGDQIGSRELEMLRVTLNRCGITSRYKSNKLIFSLDSIKPFTFEVPNRSFVASVLPTFSALFKKGKSKILKVTKTAEFTDILNFLIKCGAKIEVKSENLTVNGPTVLANTRYKNMPDVHDFVTFLSAALATNSELEFEGIDYQKMKLKYLENVAKIMNLKIDFNKTRATVLPQLQSLNAIKIYAGQPPLFVTEWQVLFSPLLTQIYGTSNVVETLYSNRMGHWMELAKMGARYKFFKDPKYPEVDGQPRAVIIKGPQKLHGAEVAAKDVRSGATLVIAGLIADGKTEILGVEHIERGYENLIGRLKKLGAKIEVLN